MVFMSNAFYKALQALDSGQRSTKENGAQNGNAFTRALNRLDGVMPQKNSTAYRPANMQEEEKRNRMLNNNLARTYSDKEYATQKQEQALLETDVEDLDRRIEELERYIEQTKIDLSLPWEKQQKELDELKRQREMARSAQYDAAGAKALADLDAGYLETLDKLLEGPPRDDGVQMQGITDNRSWEEIYAEDEAYLEGLRKELRGGGYDDKEIAQLLDYRQRQRNRENYEEEIAKTVAEAEEHKVWASVKSVPQNMTGGLGYISLASQRLHNKLTGDDKPLDYYTPEMVGVGKAQAARETVAKDMSGVGAFLYNTGMSMADSAAIMGMSMLGIPPVVGSVLLGGSAATTAATEAKKRGVSDDQALMTGLAAGTFEALFEKVSLDKVLSGKVVAGEMRERVVQTLKNIGIQSGVEGSEEFFTSIANTVTDNIINGGLSELNTLKRELMENGYSEAEADKMVSAQWAKSLALDFLGGAISGGVFGGVSTGFQTAALDAAYAEQYGSNPALVTAAMEVNGESKMAQAAQRRMAEGKQATNAQIRTMAEAVEKSVRQENEESLTYAVSAVSTRLDSLGELGDTEKIAEAVVEMVRPTTTASARAAAQKVLESSTQGQKALRELRGTMKTVDDRLSAAEEKTINPKATDKRTVTGVKYNAETKKMDAIVKKEGGGTETVPLGTSSATIRQMRLADAAAQYGEAGSVMVAGIRGDQDTDTYIRRWNLAYEYGKGGVPKEKALSSEFLRYLRPEQVEMAYEEGAKARAAEGQKKDAEQKAARQGEVKRGEGTVSMEGAVVDGVRYRAVSGAGLSKKQKAAIDVMRLFAKITGVNVVFYESELNEQGMRTQANGMYRDGVIYLDIAAGVNGADMTDAAILRTAAHELTHFIQDFSQEEYDAIKDFVLGKLAESKGVSVERLIAKKVQREAGMTPSEATDELIADGCEMMLKNESWLQALQETEPGIAKKILNFMKRWLANLRAAFRGVDAQSAEAKAMLAHMDELQALWNRGLAAAVDTYRRTEKNTAEDGGVDSQEVRFAVRMDMTESERYEELKDRNIVAVADNESRNYKEEISEIEKHHPRALSQVKGTIKDLAEKLKILRRPLTTPDINIEFQISKGNGLKESLHNQLKYGGSYSEFSKALINLKRILEHAILIDAYTKDRYVDTLRADERFEGGYVLMGAFQDAEYIIPVKLTIKKEKGETGNLYVIVAMTKIKRTSVIGSEGTTPNGIEQPLPVADSVYSLQEIVSKINTKDEDFLKYLPDEMLTDEQKHAKEEAFKKEVAKIERLRQKSKTQKSFRAAATEDPVATAETMEREGKSRGAIWQETGLIRDASGVWVAEMDDSAMKVYPKGDALLADNRDYQRYMELARQGDFFSEEYQRLGKQFAAKNKKRTLEQFVQHPELFERYPALRDVEFIFRDLGGGERGYWSAAANAIVLDESLKKDINRGGLSRAAIHEIQHAIQYLDRRAGGASVEYWEQRKTEGYSKGKNDSKIEAADREYRKLFDAAPDEVKRVVREINRAYLAKDYDRAAELADGMTGTEHEDTFWAIDEADFTRRMLRESNEELTARDLYYDTAGEIEARSAAGRSAMTAAERRDKTPELGWDRAVFADGDAQYSTRAMDSEGKQLSAQQQEYFADSVVRDADGRLKVVYHGSTAVFTEFDLSFMGRHGSAEGQGIYFTDSKTMAEGYQNADGQLMEGYLLIGKPLSDSKLTLTRAEVRKLLAALDPTGDDIIINYDPSGVGYPSRAWYNRAMNAALDMLMDGNDTDTELMGEIANINGDTAPVLRMAREVLGYDGYIVEGKYEDATVYVAFESNQFKNRDNTTPTKSGDVRYSTRGGNEDLRDGRSGDNMKPAEELLEEVIGNGEAIDQRRIRGESERVGSAFAKVAEGRRNAGYTGRDIGAGDSGSGRGQIRYENLRDNEKAKLSEILVTPVDNDPTLRRFVRTYDLESLTKKLYNGILDNDPALAVFGKTVPGFSEAIGQALAYINRVTAVNTGEVRGEVQTTTGKDSHGRMLSHAQEKFYERSKVRDKDGNLLVLYHGSASEAFAEFDMYEGVWLTPDRNYAVRYADDWGGAWKNSNNGLESELYADQDFRLYEMYADIQNPLNIGSVDGLLVDSKVRALARALGIGYVEMKALADKYAGEKTYTLTRSYEFIQLALSRGFDGLRATEAGVETWCAIKYPDQVKLTTNKNPTNNPDTRKSARDAAQITDREILAHALDSAAQTESERDLLQRYRTLSAELQQIENQLQYQRNLLTAYERGTKDMPAVEVTRARNRAASYARQADKKAALLRGLEKNRLLQEILWREKENIKRKMEGDADEYIARYEESFEKKLTDSAVEARYWKRRYEDALENAPTIAERSRREKLQKLRKEVRQKGGRLQKMLETNTDKLHVPEDLKVPLSEFLETIVFNGRKASGDLPMEYAARLRTLVAAIGAQMEVETGDGERASAYLDLPQYFVDRVNYHADQAAELLYDAKPHEQVVSRMGIEELQDLDMVLSVLSKSIKGINELHVNKQFVSVEKAAQDTIRTLDGLGQYGVKSKLGERVEGKLSWSNLLPVYAFRKLGKGGASVFEALQDGWDKLAFNSQRVINFTKETYTAKEAEAWNRELHTVELESKGERVEVQMSAAQIMSLWALSRRKQALGHILRGGIRLEDITFKGKTVRQDLQLHLTPEDIAKITSQLSSRQLEVARKIQSFMETQGSAWGNEVSMTRHGYNFFGETNYFPIETDSRNHAVKGTEKGGENDLFRLLNLSATKALTRDANNSVIVRNMFDVYTAHMADMAKYNALALPILDAIKWFNYSARSETTEGFIDDKGVHGAIEKAYGKSAEKYVVDFLRDLNGIKEGSGRGEGLARDMMGRYKRAQIAANLRVALLQPTAYVRAMAVMEPKYLAAGVAEKTGLLAAVKEMKANSGIALWKSMGFFDTDVGRSMREQIRGTQSTYDKVLDKAMIAAEKADELTWAMLWKACKAEVADKQKLQGNELIEATKKRFREVIYATQVVDSTMTRSGLMRSGSFFDKSVTSFMSEPTVTYNMVMGAVDDVRNDARRIGGKEAIKKHSRKLATAFTTYAVSAIVVGLVETLTDVWRDDDEDETIWEKVRQSAFGEGGVKGFFGGNFVSNLNPLNLIPGVSQVMSMLEGYAPSRMELGGIEQAFKSVQQLWEAIAVRTGIQDAPTEKTYYGNMTPYGLFYNASKAVSYLSGAPLSNVSREVVGIWNKLCEVAGWNQLKQVTYENKKDAANRRIWNAMAEGDDETVLAEKEKLRQSALADGEPQRTAESSATSRIRSIVRDNYWDGEANGTDVERYLQRYGGMSSEEAREQRKEWDCYIETGIKYGDIRKAYETGQISETDVVRMRTTYGGDTAEEAYNKVLWYDWGMENPLYADMGESDAVRYYEHCESAGISARLYYEAVGATKGATKQEHVDYIQSLGLSYSKSKALWLALKTKSWTDSGTPWA